MSYKRYASLMKKAAPKDAAVEIFDEIIDSSNSMEEFFRRIDDYIEKIQQLVQQGKYDAIFAEEMLGILVSDRDDPDMIKYGLTDTISWKLNEKTDELLGLNAKDFSSYGKPDSSGSLNWTFPGKEKETEWRESVQDEIRMFIRQLEEFEPQKIMDFRRELLTQPDKIDEIAKKLVEKAKKRLNNEL